MNVKAVPCLYLAVPCYNEQEVLPETAARLKEKINGLIAAGKIAASSRICLIDDGSKDATWPMIQDLHRQDALFCGLKLSRNRGHQNALLCGLMTVKAYADVAISLDADLQDDIGAIDQMLDQYRHKGCEIVYGVRSKRKTDTFFKRFTAEGFYKILRFLGADIVFNHADYRLMSRRALDGLSEFQEVNLFLRGLVPMIGYQTATVYYERSERFAGESKYPLQKMLSLAWEGITSLSTRPIACIMRLGAVMFVASLGMLLYFLIRHLTGGTIAGWSSLAVSIWAIGGLQLLSIGVIGEYIGKIYLETKRRPRYLVEEFLHTCGREQPGSPEEACMP